MIFGGGPFAPTGAPKARACMNAKSLTKQGSMRSSMTPKRAVEAEKPTPNPSTYGCCMNRASGRVKCVVSSSQAPGPGG